MLSILMLIHERNACHSLPVSIGLGNALKLVFWIIMSHWKILTVMENLLEVGR